jgi:hypothetical protein
MTAYAKQFQTWIRAHEEDRKEWVIQALFKAIEAFDREFEARARPTRSEMGTPPKGS